MARTVNKQEHILMLHESDYPITFYIIKSGHSDVYRVIEEDPFDESMKLKSASCVIRLCRMFDESITENDLPKLLTTSDNSNPVHPNMVFPDKF